MAGPRYAMPLRITPRFAHRYPPPSLPPPGCRQTPPLIGIQLYASPLSTSTSPHPDDRYDPNIMHRIVPPTLQRIIVSRDASACDIAATFSLPVSFVAANWLTSRSPMQLPGHHNPSVRHQTPHPPLRRQPLTPAELHSHRELAVAVARKLEQHLADQKHTLAPNPTRPSRARLEKLYEDAHAAIPDVASASSSTSSSISSAQPPSADPLVSTFSPHLLQNHMPHMQPPQRRVKERCGFSNRHTHPDIHLAPDRRRVSKKSTGLYRCARAAAPLANDCNYYVEFSVLENGGEGGISLGLADTNVPLNRLLGSSRTSLAYHSSGQIVMRKGTWFAYGKPYGKGDTVGLLVEMPLEDSSDVSSAESLSAPSSSASLTSASDPPTETDSALGLFSRGAPPGAARVTFFVNGESQGAVPLDMDMRQMDAEKDEDPPQLHATVCLYRPNSMVSMRCCAADWEYFPSASAVCSQLRATCQKRNSRTRVPRGSSERIVIEKGTKRAEGEQGAYSHCASVLTP